MYFVGIVFSDTKFMAGDQALKLTLPSTKFKLKSALASSYFVNVIGYRLQVTLFTIVVTLRQFVA